MAARLRQKITPFLWFDNNAEEAINFYVSVFRDTAIGATSFTLLTAGALTGTFTLLAAVFTH